MKKLLFTGASGFLGKNILSILYENYDVYTLGIEESNTYKVDLSKDNITLNTKFDVVLHAAGKAHYIPKSESDIKSFFDVNLQGTINLCRALENSIPQSFVFVSTVAVYGENSGENITEEHEKLGSSPYAKSKIMAEEYLTKWAEQNNVFLTILRPSLLAGMDPPGNLGSMVFNISKGRYLSVAGGKARKSIAMAIDVARLLPLVEKRNGIYNLCDNHNPSFNELENLICLQLDKRKPLNIPLFLALCIAKIGDFCGPKAPINTLKLEKITKSLTFSNEKIKTELNFEPTDVLANFKC